MMKRIKKDNKEGRNKEHGINDRYVKVDKRWKECGRIKQYNGR